jgi:hypothetical protein
MVGKFLEFFILLQVKYNYRMCVSTCMELWIDEEHEEAEMIAVEVKGTDP